MNSIEKITHQAGDRDAWVCICKNTPTDDGFYPCDINGKEIEPDSNWRGLYVCAECGRIIRQSTLEVIGSRYEHNK
jgi:hypothetical protein